MPIASKLAIWKPGSAAACSNVNSDLATNGLIDIAANQPSYSWTNAPAGQGYIAAIAIYSASPFPFGCTNPFTVTATVTASIAAPGLKKPDDRATGVSSNPNFEWSPVAGAAKYEVWVGESNSFSTAPYWSKSVSPSNKCSATSCSVGWDNNSGWTSQNGAPQAPTALTAGKTYFWLVWACTNSDCPLSGASQTRSFTVAGTPPPPAAGGYVVQPYIIFPSDFFDPTAAGLVDPNMDNIRSWYAGQLGGRTFKLVPAIVINSTHPISWFENGDLLNNVETLFNELGYSWNQPGEVKAIFYAGGQPGWAAGHTACGFHAYNSSCDNGFFLLGSGWLAAWNSGDPIQIEHWRYTAAHELGHGFSLVDLYRDPIHDVVNTAFSDPNLTNIAGDKLDEPNGWARLCMHGNPLPPVYPNVILIDQLFPELSNITQTPYYNGTFNCCPEKTTLRNSPFFK
jgi:hypothetical protein